MSLSFSDQSRIWMRGLSYFCFLLFLSVSSVSATEYQFERGGNNSFSRAQVIKNPENSQYVYGFLSTGEDIADYYTLEFSQFTPQVTVTLVVPSSEADSFQPTLIFADPANTRMIGKVPFGFPQNVGGRVYTWEEGEKTLSDGVVLETLRRGPFIIRDFAPSRYTLAVFDPSSQGGRYALKISAKETEGSLVSKFLSLGAFFRIKLKLY